MKQKKTLTEEEETKLNCVEKLKIVLEEATSKIKRR